MDRLNLTISLSDNGDSSANDLLRGFINAVQNTRVDISRQLEELLTWASDLKRRDAELGTLLCQLLSLSDNTLLLEQGQGQQELGLNLISIAATVPAPETLVIPADTADNNQGQRQKRNYNKKQGSTTTATNKLLDHVALSRKLLFRNKDPEANWHKPNQPIHFDNKFLIVNFGLQGRCAECEKDIVPDQAAVKVWAAPLFSYKARMRIGNQHEQAIDNASLNSATKLYCLNHAPIPLEFKEVEEY